MLRGLCGEKSTARMACFCIFSISRGRWGCEGGYAALIPPLPQIVEMILVFDIWAVTTRRTLLLDLAMAGIIPGVE
jgi:hypothetical protein